MPKSGMVLNPASYSDHQENTKIPNFPFLLDINKWAIFNTKLKE